MTVVRTERWLSDSFHDPIKLCEKLTHLFNELSPTEIYHKLSMHGMYKQPRNVKQKNCLTNHEIWEVIQKEENRLKKLWDGPNIPIFIFPVDIHNQDLINNYNGKSGLAYRNKLFMFVSDRNDLKEIQALFTHEYNHVCRLNKYKKSEPDYVLLDTIVLEGLAENAVREQVGDTYVAKWTTYYSNERLEKLWNRLILPSIHLPINHWKHHHILYGMRFFPKMGGYCVGYHIVKKYLQKYQYTIKELLDLPSEQIAQLLEKDMFSKQKKTDGNHSV